MLLVLTVYCYIELKFIEFEKVIDKSHITNKGNCMRTVEKYYVYNYIYIYIYIYIYGETKIVTQINDKNKNSANAIFGAVVAQSMT